MRTRFTYYIYYKRIGIIIGMAHFPMPHCSVAVLQRYRDGVCSLLYLWLFVVSCTASSHCGHLQTACGHLHTGCVSYAHCFNIRCLCSPIHTASACALLYTLLEYTLLVLSYTHTLLLYTVPVVRCDH